MKEHYPLRGNVTTILSPFREGTKEFDFEDLAKEIDLAARGGCVGCLCPSGARLRHNSMKSRSQYDY